VICNGQYGTGRTVFPQAMQFFSTIVFLRMVHMPVFHSSINGAIKSYNLINLKQRNFIFGIIWDMMGDALTLRMQPLYISQNLKMA
jgi:hypothetical protein